MAWYRSLYAPRTGGAYDSHHRTAGIADCARRRGGRGARNAIPKAHGSAAGDRRGGPLSLNIRLALWKTDVSGRGDIWLGDGRCSRWVMPNSDNRAAENFTTLGLSVSSAMSLPKSAGEPQAPCRRRSAERILIFGSVRPSLIALLSLTMISEGVFWVRPRHRSNSPRSRAQTRLGSGYSAMHPSVSWWSSPEGAAFQP